MAAIVLDPNTGHLAPGLHAATTDEVRVALVDAFPASTTRGTIYRLWIEHRRAVTTLVPIAGQWLNGSFATAKVDPGDADVVTFLDPSIEAIPDHEKILLSGLFHGKKTRSDCWCDAYLVVEYPPGHPAHAAAQRAKAHWRGLFEQVRGDASAIKGFVQVTG